VTENQTDSNQNLSVDANSIQYCKNEMRIGCEQLHSNCTISQTPTETLHH